MSAHPLLVLDQISSTLEGLVERAQAAERQGQRKVAREYYEAALRAIDAAAQAPLAVTLTRWIGRTHFMDGDTEAAIDCSELSLAIAEAIQDLPGIAHALNLHGTALYHRGDLDEAVQLYRSARSSARHAGDLQLAAMIEQNLGIVANIRGDLGAALEHYQASLAGYRSIGLEEYVAYALNNLGMLYTDLRRWEEAAQVYDEALEICSRSGNIPTQIMVEVNRAELWIAQGRFERARASCDTAFELAQGVNDVRALGELHKHYGVLFREAGELRRAEEHLEHAVRSAKERDDLLLFAESAREQADLFWRQERFQETLRNLNQSHQAFWQLRARRDIADLDTRMARLEDMFLEIVRRWGESIESADQYTQGHCQRVADFACALARAAGMDAQTLFWFRMGALLHDVGKIVVPVDILNKPGQLTPEERTIIERHPDAGVELLEGIDFPWDVRPMVRFHHERWGGGGYPTGIAGEEIPLSARILCIADVFDALTSNRPYRAGYSTERALDIMRNSMSSHFDPHLLELWEGICQSGAIETETPPAHAPQAPPAEEPEVHGPTRILAVSVGASARRSSHTAICEDGPAPFLLTEIDELREALGRLAEEHFDAILLDLPPEEQAGMTALEQIHEQAPETPIVVLSDLSGEGPAVGAIRRGAQEYLIRSELTRAGLARSVRCAIERNRLQMELRTRSLLDDLTGLYNRRGFFTVAPQQLKLASRVKKDLGLIFADVDGFKQINDGLGHREGDLALLDVANLLKHTFHTSDIFARMGGDEFVVLASDVPRSGARSWLKRLRDHVDRHNAVAGRRYKLSISAGVAIYDPATGGSIDELLSRADASMYAQKQRRQDHLLAG